MQHDLAKRYGYFLDFFSRSGRLDMNAPAGAQVTPDNVEAYVAELKSRVARSRSTVRSKSYGGLFN